MSDEVYELLDRKFEWDKAKAAINAVKHRVNLTEAATVFFDPFALFELTLIIRKMRIAIL